MEKGEIEDIIIKNAYIIDPSQGIDEIGDIFIRNGKINKIKLFNKNKEPLILHNAKIIDASGLYLFPGLVDMHVHLREPGYEYKETIKSGTKAAVKGGVTSICCMPNTKPVNDNKTVTQFIIQKAKAEGVCPVFPIGAVTKGQKGEELSEMGIMYEAGCIAFSDDGHPIMNALLMRRALEYSKTFDVPIISHPEDLNLSASGVVNEGEISIKLGLRGIPKESEIIMIKRDIELASLTGGKLHIAHVSTEGGVKAIKEAKKAGINITAETCPHYFTLTEKAVEGYNTNAKVNPPLRTEKDLQAIKEGLEDGTIDVIASDHAPHHKDEKLCEFERAASGISGIETLFLLSLQLYHEKLLSLSELIKKLTINPSSILKLNKGTLKPGSDADLILVDINEECTIDTTTFISKGKNSPFDGWKVRGKIIETFVSGKPLKEKVI